MSLSNLLFIAEGQLGDLLLLTPAIRAVKETFSDASVSVLVLERRSINQSDHSIYEGLLIRTDRGNGPLATNLHVDHIFTINRNALRSLRGVARLRHEFAIVRFLRARRFDAVMCTFAEDRFSFWAFVSGAPVTVGERNQPLRFLLTHTPSIEKSEAGVLDYYCRLVKAIGAEVRSHATEYEVSVQAKTWASEFLRANNVVNKFVLVHPGATGDYKIWPPERFASVIDALQGPSGVSVLLCHSGFDAAVVDQIRAHVKSQVLIADTGNDLSRLAALLQKCSLCISNDSGPRHLAVAVGAPSLAIFRKHHDREWKVYDESKTTCTIQTTRQCGLCPEGICLDRVPTGEQFGSECVRMVGEKEILEKALAMLPAS